MNKKIYIIFFILLWFILNIFFYIFSENYRYFMQSLKYDDNKYKVDDRFKIKIPIKEENKKQDNETIFSWLKENFWENTKNKKQSKDKSEKKSIKNKKNNIEEKKVEYIEKREDLKLTKIENNILNNFKKYKLKKVELHPRLFDLTDEYPDKYFEYYSKNITLYFFGNKSYNEIKDIFDVLSYELPFKINEVNNFWQKSFYINLNPLFEDWYIRLVIKKSNRTFWIKIKKELYNKIKNNLAVIFKK